MTTITQTITALPPAPDPASPSTFASLAAPFAAALPTLGTEINTWKDQANTVAGEVSINATNAATSASNAATSEANAASSASTATSAPGTSGTSTTSLTLAVAQLSFTTQTGKTWAPGMRGKLARTSNPAVQGQGYVVSYNSGTGAVVFQCEQVENAGGPYTDWTFSHEGAQANSDWFADVLGGIAFNTDLIGQLYRAAAAVSVTNAAGVAAVDLAMPTGYDYRVRFDGLRGSVADAELLIRLSTDGGATYLADANYEISGYYHHGGLAGPQAIGGNSQIAIRTSIASVQTAAPSSMAGLVTVRNPANATDTKLVEFQLASRGLISGELRTTVYTGVGTHVTSTAAVTHIRFLLSAGNITGTFFLERMSRV